MSSRPFVEDAVASAKRAVAFDGEGMLDPAIYFYNAAANLLRKAAQLSEPEKTEAFNAKANAYTERANALSEMKKKQHPEFKRDEKKQKLKRFQFLMEQALDADAAELKDTAVELYSEAIEFCTKNPEIMEGEVRDLVMQALERAEAIKGIENHDSMPSKHVTPNYTVKQPSTPTNTVRCKPALHRGSSAHLQVSGNQTTYTDEEKRVLLHTSTINNKEFVPFMNIDLKERFQYSIPFTDKEGYLALSPTQRRDFHRWVRPDDICSEPCILVGNYPNYYSIKQTIVSDCSFVASLAVSASYENKFAKKLVTAIIYPKNKANMPIYNPFGKYMVKLHLNGIVRKIIIDDHLPMNRYGQLLCSYSSNKNEFWISLLEKAYMKVMGGYDFPGSNSNIDLHALTGWIPERVSIKDKDFNRDALFSTLETRLAKGDVLITIATGEMSDEEGDRTGLVGTHAYAVMDIKTVNGVRLMKLKNPWSHLRWKGNYSEMDNRHWTPELQKLLNYDPNSAAQFDNGVFWIDYDSVCAFYDVIYMNWNLELFNYTYCIHQTWNACTGPVKDLYSMGSNPQYSLEIGPNATGAVWILLTRHITDIEDFRENREFITVLVYKANGKRVYYPNEPPPYIDGIRINSPHYLCKILLSGDSSRKFTLVISQYEKTSTIYYTLRAYATCPFSLNKIGDPFIHKKEISGEWKGFSAGGCGNHTLTYKNNPKVCLEIDSVSDDNHILIEMKGPKQYQVGFDVTIVTVKNENITAPFKTQGSGPYRSGYVVLDLENIPAGTLRIIPTTFLPNQEGPFILTVKSSAPISLHKET